ncbi:MAG: hypothetical protein R2722_01770 [Tessaracoccus sp.]
MTWFAIGYAVVLVCVAYGIDAMAKRAARSVEQQRSGGFVYHESHDAWLCPEDQWLWPQSFDPENRVMRYRALPTVCNACPVKDTCTTSNSGREVQRAVDPWPASESARFHRGIACTVGVLGAAWPLAAAAATSDHTEAWVLIGTAFLAVVASLPLFAHLRRTPADPTGVLLKSSDDNADERLLMARRQQTRRTVYRSDRPRRI